MSSSSNQAVFDAAWRHIHKQGKPAVDMDGACMYLEQNKFTGSPSPRCAFGPCILVYDPSMESKAARELLSGYRGNLHSWARDCDPNLADLIQSAHDLNAARQGGTFMRYFEEKMHVIAGLYDLTVPS